MYVWPEGLAVYGVAGRAAKPSAFYLEISSVSNACSAAFNDESLYPGTTAETLSVLQFVPLTAVESPISVVTSVDLRT